jgi:hypothetical protein
MIAPYAANVSQTFEYQRRMYVASPKSFKPRRSRKESPNSMSLFEIGAGSSVFNHSPLKAFINHFESSIEITVRKSIP